MIMPEEVYYNVYTGEYLKTICVGEYKDPTTADTYRKSVVCKDMETQCIKIIDYDEFTERKIEKDPKSERVFQKITFTISGFTSNKGASKSKVKPKKINNHKKNSCPCDDYINFDNNKEE